jgi:hypothetical protein
MTAHMEDMTMQLDIEGIAVIAAAATRGPWRWEHYRYGTPDLVGVAGDPGVYEYSTDVLEATHTGGCGCRSACELELNISDADSAYIAAASPDVLLQLIERVRRAEAAIERIRQLQPTWHPGMYGSPDDKFSAVGIARALEGQ